MPPRRPALRGVRARNLLAGLNRPLLYWAAYRLRRRVPPVRRLGTVEDVAQAGVPGLLRACELYDPARGIAFATYAYASIKSHVLRAAHYAGPVATHAGVGYDAAPRVRLRPMRRPPGERAAQEPADREHDPCRELDVAEALASLESRRRAVFTRHLAGVTFAALAAELGVSRMRVCVLYHEAAAHLRERLAAYGPGG